MDINCNSSSTSSEEDELLSLSETNITFVEAAVCSHESLSWKVLINNDELEAQCDDGRSRSIEEEHRLPKHCAGVVDCVDSSYLSCGDDRNNCGFNGNGILCELIGSNDFSDKVVQQQHDCKGNTIFLQFLVPMMMPRQCMINNKSIRHGDQIKGD